MTEFMFRNLSVKLFPANDEACADATTQPECTPCTHLITGPHESCDHTCFGAPSIPIAVGPVCDGPPTFVNHVDSTTNLISPVSGDIRFELTRLKGDLRRQLAAVAVQEQELLAAARPTTVEQIDMLKAQLLATVAELDEQRAQLTGDAPAPAQE
jgi:hypothetical protein